MSSSQQQFTFIDVTAQTQANRKRIKTHVANDVNRKKRQIAVEKYQSSRLAETSKSNRPTAINISPTISPISSTVKTSISPSADTTPAILPALPPASGHVTKHAVSQDVAQASSSDGVASYLNSWSVFTSSLTRRGQAQTRLTRSYDGPRDRLRKRSSSHDSVEIETSILVNTFISRSRSTCIPRIDAPLEFNLAQSSLRNIQVFLHGKYQSTWSHAVREDPFYYQHDYEVGLWRECFFLAFDSLNKGETCVALGILDASLGATSALVKKQHPSLLNSLLEVMQEAKDVKDERLSCMIQSYLVQMTTTLLGAGHPIAAFMRIIQSRPMDENHGLEVLFDAIVDVIGELFGPNHFQTLGTIFGQTRYHTTKGNLEKATSCLSCVEEVWKAVFPEGSAPLQVIAVEKAKVAEASIKTDIALSSSLDVAIAALRELAELTRSSDKDTAVVSEPESLQIQSAALPETLDSLGRQLVSGSYHALSLYVYTHLDEVFVHDNTSTGSSMPNEGRLTFPSRVARILLQSHLQEHALKTGVHPQRSNASIQEVPVHSNMRHDSNLDDSASGSQD